MEREQLVDYEPQTEYVTERPVTAEESVIVARFILDEGLQRARQQEKARQMTRQPAVKRILPPAPWAADMDGRGSM